MRKRNIERFVTVFRDIRDKLQSSNDLVRELRGLFQPPTNITIKVRSIRATNYENLATKINEFTVKNDVKMISCYICERDCVALVQYIKTDKPTTNTTNWSNSPLGIDHLNASLLSQMMQSRY